MNRILLCLALIVCSFAAQAQEAWPARPVKFIVPSSPGGGTDVYARILAQALAESLKQQFIVDNRPGDRKSTRLNSSHSQISYAVFCLKKKKNTHVSSYP